MNFAFAGCPIVGAVQLNETQLDRLIQRIRAGFRSILNALKQPGRP
jgi:hypothetical protein